MTDEAISGTPPAQARRLLEQRLAIGALQGTAAWLLLALLPNSAALLGHPDLALWWPYRHPAAFAAFALLIAFVPVVALAEIGRMPMRRLWLYLAVLAAVLSAMAGYDIWRDPLEGSWNNVGNRVWPSPTLIFCAGIGTFIVNQLLEHRERGAGLWAAYADHFEDSWMRAFQFVLALAFTLLVWAVLELGRALFDLIHLDWFGHMIEHNWFRCPVLAVAFAASVHITDVRPALLHGMRNLGLTLLAWLLPLVAVLGWGFLLALVFTGLSPLWGTRFAATILLSAVAVTLVLVNAAYKDGDNGHAPPAIIRWAGRAAAPMMLLLTLLGIYAITLRVAQYGWTPMRLRSAMVAAIALLYALGYTRAAALKGDWLKRIEPVNVSASLAIVAVLALKLSPVADPSRIAVNSQLFRLTSGKLAPARFDYQFLRFDAGIYGTRALDKLARNASGEIASRARLALAERSRIYFANGSPDPAQTEPPFSHAAIYPRGAALPDSFRSAKWGAGDGYFPGPDCLRNGARCDIIVLPGGHAKSPLLLVIEGADTGTPATAAKPVATVAALARSNTAPVYGLDSGGKWQNIGTISMIYCSGVREALRLGRAAPLRPAHDDLAVNGMRLPFSADDPTACPAMPAPKAKVVPPSDASAPAGMGPAFGRPGGL